MFVLDSHCDTPSAIFRGRDIILDNPYAHVDFPKLLRGGVDGVFFALYVPASLDHDPQAAYNYAMRLLSGVKSAIWKCSEIAEFVTDCTTALKNKNLRRLSVFLGLENGSPLSPQGSWKNVLSEFYAAGVRYMTLCHSAHNEICDSCAPASQRWNGLSPFGREVVEEMNRLGMIVDVSHISDAAFYDVLKCTSKPVVATHSCCRALADHPRNMTDDMIKALAANGGVIQINFYPLFLDGNFKNILERSGIPERGEVIEAEYIADPYNPEKKAAWNRILDELHALDRPSYTLIADHIDHVVSLVGIDHVGLGSDFDGIEVTPAGLDDISCMPLIFEELRSRGYSEADLCKIASGNFFRVLSAQ